MRVDRAYPPGTNLKGELIKVKMLKSDPLDEERASLRDRFVLEAKEVFYRRA